MNAYVIAATPNVIKVGMAEDPFYRMRQLQQQLRCAFVLMHIWRCERHSVAYELEGFIHRQLHADALGGEWFGCGIEAAIAASERAPLELWAKFYFDPFWRYRDPRSRLRLTSA